MKTARISTRDEWAGPRWTWRAVGGAGLFTLMVFVLLPYLEHLAVSSGETLELRSVMAARVEPPALPPLAKAPVQELPRKDLPKPELQEEPLQLEPFLSDMALDVSLANIHGDFSVRFNQREPEVSGEGTGLVFAVSDLDQAPQPLSRLEPFYPSSARLKKIEGEVILEFVVQANGRVRDIQVILSRPEGVFENSAVRAIERWRFVPGTKEGRAVDTRVRQQVTFALE